MFETDSYKEITKSVSSENKCSTSFFDTFTKKSYCKIMFYNFNYNHTPVIISTHGKPLKINMCDLMWNFLSH